LGSLSFVTLPSRQLVAVSGRSGIPAPNIYGWMNSQVNAQPAMPVSGAEGRVARIHFPRE
jgi:hypothetical protein